MYARGWARGRREGRRRARGSQPSSLNAASIASRAPGSSPELSTRNTSACSFCTKHASCACEGAFGLAVTMPSFSSSTRTKWFSASCAVLAGVGRGTAPAPAAGAVTLAAADGGAAVAAIITASSRPPPAPRYRAASQHSSFKKKKKMYTAA